MLALNILTSAVSVYSCLRFRRRFRELSESTAEAVKSAERCSVEAASNALILADLVREGGLSPGDSSDVSGPVVVGYGQTRTKKAIYVYRDVRDADGVVSREFVKRIPFSGK